MISRLFLLAALLWPVLVHAQFSDQYRSLGVQSLLRHEEFQDAGDLSGDGNADYLLLSHSHGRGRHLAWITHARTGTEVAFPRVIHLTTGVANHAAIRDVDGDGDNDIFVQGRRRDEPGNFLIWLENLAGDGSRWAERTVVGLPFETTNTDPALFGDPNGDGRPDAIYAAGGQMYFVANAGNGTFLPPLAVTSFDPAYSVSNDFFADVTGDGVEDYVFLGTRRNFEKAFVAFDFTTVGPQTVPPPDTLGFVRGSAAAFIDYDRDGRANPFVDRGDAGTFVYLYRPEGLREVAVGPVGDQFSGYDLDRDGISDLVVHNYRNETLSFLPGRAGGNGPFYGPAVLLATAVKTHQFHGVVDDFADGHVELLGELRFPTTGIGPGMLVLEATGPLPPAVMARPLYYPLDLATARIPRGRPGKWASLVANSHIGSPGALYRISPQLSADTLRYRAEPLFVVPDPLAGDRFYSDDHLKFAEDLNRDGYPELLLQINSFDEPPHERLYVAVSDRHGNYRMQTLAYDYRIGDGIRTATFRRRDPVLLINDRFDRDCPVRLRINAADGTIAATGQCITEVTNATWVSLLDHTTLDVDGDGHDDLVLAPNDDVVVYARYDPATGGYAPALPLAMLTYNSLGLSTGDYNGDGRTDLSGLSRSSYRSWVALAGPDGTFDYREFDVDFPLIPGQSGFCSVDWTGNGRDDLLILFGAESRRIALTEGNRWAVAEALQLYEPVWYDEPTDFTDYQLTDVDGDGDRDLLLHDRDLHYYPNLARDGNVTVATYLDANGNGERETEEPLLPHVAYTLDGDEGAAVRRDQGDGRVTFYVTGREERTVRAAAGPLWAVTPDSLTVRPQGGPKLLGRLFAATPLSQTVDYRLEITAGRMRCATEVPVWIDVLNTGTLELAPGFIELVVAEDVVVLTPPDSVAGGRSLYRLPRLGVAGRYRIGLTVLTPPGSAEAREIDLAARAVLHYAGNPVEREAQRSDLIRCSYDPNDKAVRPRGAGRNGYLTGKPELTYTIRFQNTGNDTALLVTLRDTLDIDLDPASLTVLASSHDVVTELETKTGALHFTFYEIDLVDSMTNPVGSQGFVTFRLRPRANRVEGTQLTNRASIYFDRNAPIVTNETLNTLVRKVPSTATYYFDARDLRLTLSPNPAATVAVLELTGRDWAAALRSGLRATLVSGTGAVLRNWPLRNAREPVDVGALPPGTYFLRIAARARSLATVTFVVQR